MSKQAEETYVTRSGRRVHDRHTDQPGTRMVIRTVSKNTNGSARDRPAPCIQVAFAGGIREAQDLADQLDRVGYLPPERPMPWEEFEAAAQRLRLNPLYSRMAWAVAGLGMSLGMAVRREPENEGKKNIKVRLRRVLKDLGMETEPVS